MTVKTAPCTRLPAIRNTLPARGDLNRYGLTPNRAPRNLFCRGLLGVSEGGGAARHRPASAGAKMTSQAQSDRKRISLLWSGQGAEQVLETQTHSDQRRGREQQS
jgi:hypothetical protein